MIGIDNIAGQGSPVETRFNQIKQEKNPTKGEVQTTRAETQPATASDLPAAEGEGRPEDRGVELHQQMFVSLNNSFLRSELQFGVLPINTETDRLLLSGQISEQRNPSQGNYYRLEHQQLDLTLEPQYQRQLGDGWNLYARLPLTFRGVDQDDHSSLDLLADVTVGRHGDKHVFRLEYGVSGLGGEGAPAHRLAFTPYQRFDLYKDYLTLRVGAKYSFDFGADFSKHLVAFEGKVGGMIKKDPWSGWGIQFFVPVALDKKLSEGQHRIDLAGAYAWVGSVLPSGWFGPGFFIEGGVWIGGEIDKSPTPFREIIGGIGIKIKYGTEARWWQ